MKYLLDHELLAGPHEVQTGLRPLVLARCAKNLAEAEAAAVRLCQTWGGSGNPLAVIAGGGPATYLQEQLISGEIDGYSTVTKSLEVSIPFLKKEGEWDYPAALVVAHETQTSRPIQVVTLNEADPWRLSYLGTLGWLPDMLDPFLCQQGNLRALDHAEVIDLEHVDAVGGLGDLLGRLADQGTITPRQFSSLYLATGRSPNTGYMGTDGFLPSVWEKSTAAGPNIVVVMGKGSVDDFALLWNLRGSWGDSRSLPIGVPIEALDARSLQELREPGVSTPFGFAGGGLCLVSESIPISELQEIARTLGVKAALPRDLLRFGQAPSRPGTQVQVWEEGRARLTPMTDMDRHIFSAVGQRMPSLWLSARVPNSPLPAVGSLRSPYFSGFHAGAAQLQVSSLRKVDSVEVVWPSTWTSLAASALTRGLEVRESQSGIAGMGLIRAIGNTRDILNLADKSLIDLLYELAERSGMSWWKGRWNRVEARLREEGKSEQEIESLAIELGRDDPAIAPPNEGRQLPYSRFQSCFKDRRATERWLGWVTEKRLIVKGVELDCPDCRVSFWLPVEEMAPPNTCPGCARTLFRPFRADAMNFKYRIGEVLRRCLEVDALGHVLALRWLADLFDRHGLIGAHPGVEFLKDGEVVAEVDVVLLFQDGSMVPVEVKRRAHAFDAHGIEQLDAASALLHAEFDVMSVMEPMDSCSGVLPFKRALPDRPRVLLSLDHLSEQHVVWSMGSNPFELGPTDAEGLAKRRKAWVEAMALIGESPIDRTENILEDWRRKGSV